MLVPIQTQFYLILHSMLAGMITGIVFDIYRLIRGFENPDRVLTFIEDILFWIFAGILVFIFLIYTGYAYVGIHLYIYIALGLYIYLKLMSTPSLKVQHKTIEILAKFLRVTMDFLIYPLQLIIYRFIRKNK